MTLKDLLDSKNDETKRKLLDQELPKLVDRIVYKIYRYRDYVIYHVVIPSGRSTSDATYDVILEIKTLGFRSGAAKMDQQPLRVFSNCPSFIFGFAHNYWKQHLLCDWLLDKYDKKVTESAPTKPTTDTLERSIYLAAAYIHSVHMDDENIYKTAGRKVDHLRSIQSTVRTQAQIMAKAREKITKDPELKKPTEPDKAPESTIKPRARRPRTRTKTIKTGTVTKTTKNIKTTKMTKSTKTTKIR